MPKFGLVCFLIFSGIVVDGKAQKFPQATQADRLYQQGDFQGAAGAYHDLVQSWQSLNNADSANYYQYWEAKSHIQQYEYQKARTLLQSILSQSPLPDSALLSKAYHELSYTYMSEGEFQQAKIFSEKSIDIEQSRIKTDTFQLAKQYELKGFILLQTGDPTGAKKWVTTAHQLRKAVLDPMDKELGYSANTLYIILSSIGEWQQLDTLLSEAWKILNHHLPEDHPHIAIIANNYSTYLMDMGDPQNAKEYLLKAISSNEKGKRYFPLATNYVNLGLLYLNLGESKTAESYYQQAWYIADTLLTYPDYNRANIKDALGAVYYQQHQLDKADSMFNASLKEKQDLYEEEESAEIAQSLYNLGLIASDRENWSLAKKYFSQSEKLRSRTLGDEHPKRADAVFELAEIAWSNEKPAEAIDLWRNSLQIYQQSFGLPHHHTLENLIRLTEAFDKQKKPDSVQHYLKLSWGSATGQNKAIIDFTALATLAINRYNPKVLMLANVHLKLLLDKENTLSANDLNTGQQILKAVHAWLPTFLSLFNDASLQESVTEQVQDFYRQGAILAHRALNIPDSEQASWQLQLLNCIQASRGATIQAAFKDRQAIQFAGVPDSLVHRAQVLKQQLQFTFARQQNSQEEEESSQMAQQQLAILQSWQELQQYLQLNYPQYYQARFEIPSIDRKAMQQTLKDGNYTVLAYFNLDSALLAVHLKADGLTSSWLKMPIGWQDSLRTYQQLLQNQTDVSHQARLGYFLYKHLWKSLALSPQSHVKILADGPLFYFNFETLLTYDLSKQSAASTWPWLIKEFCIYYGHTLPGTMSLSSDRQGNILGIAPGFSESLKTNYLNSLHQDQTPDSLFLQWIRTPWSTAFVQQLPQKGWGTALTESAATETLFQREAPKASILHFGTHARLENEKPLYSFLALTPDPDTQQDGYLYTYELYNEPLKAQLAVLTACETGLGSYRRGEGVLSLAHAFRYAGCPSVVYSLWSIDDQQSNQIAELFYENLQKDMTLAEALRAAKLAYLENAGNSFQSPYYWAGLVLTGDDQSVKLSTSWLSSWIIWSVSGLVLLILLWVSIRTQGLKILRK